MSTLWCDAAAISDPPEVLRLVVVIGPVIQAHDAWSENGLQKG
jgi:hypothetical protein